MTATDERRVSIGRLIRDFVIFTAVVASLPFLALARLLRRRDAA
ncbi:MAG: hypothetical protein ABI637_08950 [Gemmatimonadota bacterium]